MGVGRGVRRVRVRVPAKVNLFLAVRGVRADGLHEVVSVMQTVSLHDTVTASVDGAAHHGHPATRRFVTLDFSAEGAQGIPLGEDNLAVRAARSIMRDLGIGGAGSDGGPDVAPANVTGRVVALHLDKRIPIAAGMAGGSADAAATLIALDRLFDGESGRDALIELGASLGADVPFCVRGGTALATGTGTATAQVLARGTFAWVIGVDDRPLSTGDVYRAHDELGTSSRVEPDLVLQAVRTGDADLLAVALHNDLEAAAFHLRPELARRREALIAAGALAVVVSGSGPTLLGLARDAEHARAIAERVREVFPRVEVAASPAGGPELAVD